MGGWKVRKLISATANVKNVKLKNQKDKDLLPVFSDINVDLLVDL